jgi:hypothetical protein
MFPSVQILTVQLFRRSLSSFPLNYYCFCSLHNICYPSLCANMDNYTLLSGTVSNLVTHILHSDQATLTLWPESTIPWDMKIASKDFTEPFFRPGKYRRYVVAGQKRLLTPINPLSITNTAFFGTSASADLIAYAKWKSLDPQQTTVLHFEHTNLTHPEFRSQQFGAS